MELKNFYPLYMAKLSLADLYSLSRSTIDYALPVKDSLGDLLKVSLTQLETENAAMCAALHKPVKSGFTPMLKIKNNERKECFFEIRRNIQTNSKSSDMTKKTAGSALKIFTEPFWDTGAKAMNTATAVFDEMITKYRTDEKLVVHAATIGIAAMIDRLDSVNREFAGLYHTRNSEGAATEGPSASSLKLALVKCYEQFCMALEQAVNFVPNETLNTLFSQLDELRKKYTRLATKPDNGEENTSSLPLPDESV